MTHIITDEQAVDAVLARGVDEVIQHDELRKKMLSGEQLRVKLGIDPTSPNLHLGRSVPLLKLRDFQALGHQVILIVGDFTGVIGDTSDKDAERPMLSEEDIERNKASYFDQIGKILDLDSAELRYNSEWLKPLNYRDIGEQANLFSVADFIARDNIKRRLETGTRVSLREMLYPLMQGYDSVAVEADVELGGTDQRFNLLAGRHMQPQYGQKPQSIVTGPLINGLDGRKMSSSWGNTINFNDEPLDMYGKVMSMGDEMLIEYFIYFTRIPMEKITEYQSDLASDRNPMEIKHELASEIVRMYHSKDAATEAGTSWKSAFSGGGVPDDVPELPLGEATSLSEALINGGYVSSKTDFRRLLEAGAIREHKDNDFISLTEDTLPNLPATLKIGKKRFLTLVA
jgi:tyrosyl-tRNA synthetase